MDAPTDEVDAPDSTLLAKLAIGPGDGHFSGTPSTFCANLSSLKQLVLEIGDKRATRQVTLAADREVIWTWQPRCANLKRSLNVLLHMIRRYSKEISEFGNM